MTELSLETIPKESCLCMEALLMGRQRAGVNHRASQAISAEHELSEEFIIFFADAANNSVFFQMMIDGG
jgi:hypothetical protein